MTARSDAERRALPALQELVRLKRVKERMEQIAALPSMGAQALEYAQLKEQYDAAKDKAWAEAFAVFGDCPQCKRRWNNDCWYQRCARRA